MPILVGDSLRLVGGGSIGSPDAGPNSGFGWHSVDPKVVEPLLTVVTLVVVLLLTAATDGGRGLQEAAESMGAGG